MKIELHTKKLLKLRQSKSLTRRSVINQLKKAGIDISIGALQTLERGNFAPAPKSIILLVGLCDLLECNITDVIRVKKGGKLVNSDNNNSTPSELEDISEIKKGFGLPKSF